MSEQIRHEGIVLSVSNSMARVQIQQVAACGSCTVSKNCMAADVKRKEVDCVFSEPLEVGDRVEVIAEKRMGVLSVVLAYVIPILLVMLTLLLGDIYIKDEAITGTLALSMLLPYLLVLHLLRDKLKNTIQFTARKL